MSNPNDGNFFRFASLLRFHSDIVFQLAEGFEKRLFRFCLTSVILFYSTNFVYSQTGEVKLNNIGELIAEWKKRDLELPSARIRWTESRWVSGEMLAHFARRTETSLENVVGNATTDKTGATGKSSYTLVFNGEKYRHTSSYGGGESGSRISVWNGKEGRAYRVLPSEPIQGEVRDFPFDLTQPSTFALRSAFRSFHPDWYQSELEGLELKKQTELLNGVKCYVLETSDGQLKRVALKGRTAWIHKYWVHPYKYFSVVKYTRTKAGSEHPRTAIDVKVEGFPTYGWLPRRWIIVSYDNAGEPKTAVDVRVTDLIVNPDDVSVEQFVLDFPEKTLVRDYVKGHEFIATADGGRRLVTREERINPGK